MYEPLLLIHSWLRWGVYLYLWYIFIYSTVSFLKKRKWETSNQERYKNFISLFALQAIFGVTIWLTVSPFTRAAFNGFKTALNNPIIFFWTIRHGLTMILALTIFQYGLSMSRKIKQENIFKLYSIICGVVILLITSAIPWPWLSYGRKLFRWPL